MIRPKTKDLIEESTQDLEKINQQRRWWLLASSLVFSGIVLLIFGWEWIENLHSKLSWWAVVSMMLILSINWWYWTMRVMLRLVRHQKMEFHIISELIIDIKELKIEIRQLGTRKLDKDN